MIDILGLDPVLLFGVAGAVGATVRGIITFYKLKRKDKKVSFDFALLSDTVMKGVAGGIAFSAGMPLTYAALGLAALAGTGVDTYANKLGISIIPPLRDYVKEHSKQKEIEKKK